MREVDATEAVFARNTMGQKVAVAAVFTKLTTLESVAMFTHGAVVAELGCRTVRAINAIPRFHTILTVHRIFGSSGIENKIAVTDSRIVIAIITVDRLMEGECSVWHLISEGTQL